MRITIQMPEPAMDRLRDLARRERRTPRDQAALLLELAVKDVPPLKGYEPPAPRTPIPEAARG